MLHEKMKEWMRKHQAQTVTKFYLDSRWKVFAQIQIPSSGVTFSGLSLMICATEKKVSGQLSAGNTDLKRNMDPTADLLRAFNMLLPVVTL